MSTIRASVAICIVSCGPAFAYDRVSLDEKVRRSDLIIIGSVVEIASASPHAASLDPAEDARKIATVRINSILKGTITGERVRVGFEMVYPRQSQRDTRNDAKFEIGRRYLLYLRKLPGSTWATVNRGYGSFEISDGAVIDPRYPTRQVRGLFRRNTRTGGNGWPILPRFQDNIPVDTAVEIITTAVKRANVQLELGRIELDETFSDVLFESGADRHLLLVRAKRYADCPSLDMTRFDALLLTRDGKSINAPAPTLTEVPASVDPLSVTDQVTFSFPATIPPHLILGVQLTLDDEVGIFCLPDVRGSETCPEESAREESRGAGWQPVVRGTFFLPQSCPACKSTEVRAIHYGKPSTRHYSSLTSCQRAKLYTTFSPGGCSIRDESWICRSCGLQWE